MKINDVLKVTIKKLDHFGRGIAYEDNHIIFVFDALTDEEVMIKITKLKKDIAEAIVLNYLTVSPKRIKPLCPYYQLCGGCHLSHMDIKEQLIYKENKVKEIMNKYAKLDTKVIEPIIGTSQYYYRNKANLKIKGNKIGYYKEGTNELVPINECLLLDKRINALLPTIKAKDTVTIRVGEEVMIDSSRPYITMHVGNYRYQVSPSAFFQVNNEGCLKLYNKIKEYAALTGHEQVLDLYCGVGSIDLFLAKEAKEVHGIEINESAINDAKANAKLNHITNISFEVGDITKIEIDYQADVIVIDPPRSGLTKEVINWLQNCKATKIIYVACDPLTLARDLKALTNYEVKALTPLDMFPNTYHVENIALLVKAGCTKD